MGMVRAKSLRVFGVQAVSMVAVLSAVSCAHHKLALTSALPDARPSDAKEEREAKRHRARWEPPDDPRAWRVWMEARKRSAERIQRLRATLGMVNPKVASASVNPFEWTFIGPQPIVNTSNNSNPYAGSVYSIALDPMNPSVIYAVTFAGRLWKSTNNGATWTPLSDFGPLVETQTVSVDPNLPNIVYVLDAGVIYKSADGGSTWSELPPVVSDSTLGCAGYSFTVHPSTSGTWLISEYCSGTQPPTSVLYRSTDFGATWTQVQNLSNTFLSAMQFNSSVGDYAYGLGFQYTARGAFFEVSTDAGRTWTQATGTDPAPLSSILGERFAAAPSNPKTIYISGLNYDGSDIAVFKTTDLGLNWVATSFPSGNHVARGAGLLAVHPNIPNLVFAGGQHLFRSEDGGASWQPADTSSLGMDLHVDHHSMIYTPNGARAYESNDGGVWTATQYGALKPDWTNLNATFGTAEIYVAAIDPNNVNTAFAGTQDNATLNFQGAIAWQQSVCGDGLGLAINPQSPNVVYALCLGSVFRSLSGGIPGTWSQLPGFQGIFSWSSLTIDPTTPRVLYMYGFPRGSGNALIQTVDGGDSWSGTGLGLVSVTALGISQSDSNFVVAADADGNLWSTANALAGVASTWTLSTNVNTLLSSHTPAIRPRFIPGINESLYVQRVLTDPRESRKTYALIGTFEGGNALAPFRFGTPKGFLLESVDGAATWHVNSLDAATMGSPVDLFVDPDLPTTMYLATDLSVFRSSDGGAKWYPLASGLPFIDVSSLTFHHSARILRVTTIGRGLWDLAVPTTAPRLSNVSLSLAASGDTVTINGVNFDGNSVVRLNGANLATTLVSPTQLTAIVPASALPSFGTYYVGVYEPGPGGGLSDPLQLVYGPTISLGPSGVVNAASFASGGIVPGSIATLFGTNLLQTIGINLASGIPLPSTLLSDSVMVGNTAASIFAVDNVNGQQQINFQVPWELTGQTTTTIAVVSNGFSSAAVTVPVLAAQPGIFNYIVGGQSFGAILHANYQLADSGHPSVAGETVLIYCTGLGPASFSPVDGRPGNGQTTNTTPVVTIGGLNAPISFSGLAPGFVGLYQVNVQVPSGLAAGNQPVVMTMLGAASNAVLLPVK